MKIVSAGPFLATYCNKWQIYIRKFDDDKIEWSMTSGAIFASQESATTAISVLVEEMTKTGEPLSMIDVLKVQKYIDNEQI